MCFYEEGDLGRGGLALAYHKERAEVFQILIVMIAYCSVE